MLRFFIVLALLCLVNCLPRVEQGSISSAQDYLLEYGYLNGPNLFSEPDLRSAIENFQGFAGLEQTGIIDNATASLMNSDRCGVKDLSASDFTIKRRKRFALSGTKWNKNTLTYRIEKYSTKLSRSVVDNTIRRALDLWSSVTNLEFVIKGSGEVDLEILFGSRDHGDEFPFDGTGQVLAHAYFPGTTLAGDAHFDEDENWTGNSATGVSFLQVAVHEFGHSLGLRHSEVRDAIMTPFYRYRDDFKLHADDINGIQTLYGQPNTRPPSTSAPTTRPTRPTRPTSLPGDKDFDNTDLCKDPEPDTMFQNTNGSLFVFKGSQYWKLTSDSIAPGYPRRISQDWKGLPGNIDAAFTFPLNKKTFFFKGDEYWVFKDKKPKKGYPRKISRFFNGIPNNIDGAFVWPTNGNIYIFKDNEYWRINPNRTPNVVRGYPRSISVWKLPRNTNIKSVLNFDQDYSYFFSNRKYWRLNNRSLRIDDGDPPFPRETGPWWFSCRRRQE